MSAQQDEALRLADALDVVWAGGIAPEAANELRRLHAENQQLRAALKPPQSQQDPVAWIENSEGALSYNPYHEAARKLPDGVRFDLYVHQQNLRCKSNQARLAALWGYEKKQPPRQPLTDEQITQVLGNVREQLTGNVFLAFARAIERAHGIGGEA